jgi:hypothetical protein
MTINGKTVKLDLNDQNIIINDTAPFTLSLNTSGVSLNKKIRKIECLWDDGTNDIFNYKVKSGIDNILFYPKDIGDPRNQIITKDFYSNDYNTSTYYNIINFYVFGDSSPYSYNIVLNLSTPDFIDTSFFTEFHLSKTRMFGPSNDLLYTFNAYDSNSGGDYTFLSLVNWTKKTNKLTAKSFNRPYNLVLPFLQKFNNNTNIETLTAINVTKNPDNEVIFLPTPTPTKSLHVIHSTSTPTMTPTMTQGGALYITPTPTPTITPSQIASINQGYLNSPLVQWNLIINSNGRAQYISLDSYDYPIHSFGSFTNDFVIGSYGDLKTNLGYVQDYSTKDYQDLRDISYLPPFVQSLAYYGGTNTRNTNNLKVSNYNNPLIGYALNGVKLYRPAATVSMVNNILDSNKWPIIAGYTYNAAYQAVSNINDPTYQFGHDLAGGIPINQDTVKYTGYGYTDGSFLAAWLDGVGSTIGYVSNLQETSYLKYYKQNNSLNYKNGHSKIVGISLDGYPIYGPYGYSSNTTSVKKLNTSYRLKNSSYRTVDAPTSNYPMGIFIEDYEYVDGLGDLDQSNGRHCVTPEYPKGTYAYFITIDDTGIPVYPYIIGNIWYNTPSYTNSTSAGTGTQPILS